MVLCVFFAFCALGRVYQGVWGDLRDLFSWSGEIVGWRSTKNSKSTSTAISYLLGVSTLQDGEELSRRMARGGLQTHGHTTRWRCLVSSARDITTTQSPRKYDDQQG